MAAYTKTTSTHQTFTGTTADSLVLSAAAGVPRILSVEVANRDTTNALYFTVAFNAAATTAVAAADGTYYVGPSSSLALPLTLTSVTTGGPDRATP